MTRYDVTSVGEGGLRLSVPAGERMERARRLDVQVAGTEGNVLSGLSALGWRTGWFTSLPDSALGRRVEEQYRSLGVDTSGVRRVRGARVGTYFVEYGSAPRATHVTFDRKDTAFSLMTTEDVEWNALLDTRLVHLSGLTAALSPSALEILRELRVRASSAGIPVSFDVNYRRNLWSAEDSGNILLPLVEGVEILFCSREDARLLFNVTGEPEECARALCTQTGARHVIVSCGGDGFVGVLDGRAVRRAALPVTVVDRLGAGDGLAAGFLHGWLAKDLELGVEAAVAMAALALAQWGEQVATTARELESVIADPARDVDR